MKVVAVASRQSGSGKSTLACQIAAAAQALEYSPAVLVDMARGGATRRWGAARRDGPPICVRSTADRLGGLVAKLALGRTALTVIDTAPFQLVSNQSAVVLADLVLIPVSATAAGIETARRSADMARRAGAPPLFVLNGVDSLPEPAMLRSLQAIAPLAPAVVRRHAIFRDCMATGRTVFELEPFGDATRDIHELWNAMAFRLEASERPPLHTAAE
jgi:chromosome partitioning protein